MLANETFCRNGFYNTYITFNMHSAVVLGKGSLHPCLKIWESTIFWLQISFPFLQGSGIAKATKFEKYMYYMEMNSFAAFVPLHFCECDSVCFWLLFSGFYSLSLSSLQQHIVLVMHCWCLEENTKSLVVPNIFYKRKPLQSDLSTFFCR